LRQHIVTSYYDPHHAVLTQVVESHLEIYGMARIIDCHSYPLVPLQRDLDQTQPRPDFNIGISSFHTPESWIESSKTFFSEHGYTLGVDWPYAGTMVPMKHYQKDVRVQSMMLEINRDLYLEPGSIRRSANFEQVRRLVGEWIEFFL
jgi:N-formylglutamate amidohydrolase